MKPEIQSQPPISGLTVRCFALSLLLLLTACAGHSPLGRGAVRYDEPGVAPVLAYYQLLQRMSGAEIHRERMVLAALPTSPNSQLRMAMVLGHPRGQVELARAASLLDAVLKSSDPNAGELQPLARLLADNYAERQKIEQQAERQGQQLRESQRKVGELQAKIEGLVDIERNLPKRQRATRSPAPGGQP